MPYGVNGGTHSSCINSSSPLVPHLCASESGQHGFRWWLVAYSAPSHYINQCWIIINWIHMNKLQWNFNQSTKLFIHENAFEMVAILSRGDEFKNRSKKRCMFFLNSKSASLRSMDIVFDYDNDYCWFHSRWIVPDGGSLHVTKLT